MYLGAHATRVPRLATRQPQSTSFPREVRGESPRTARESRALPIAAPLESPAMGNAVAVRPLDKFPHDEGHIAETGSLRNNVHW